MVSNLEYYRSFFWVATLHSFTQAADLLYVSQSAVSQSVRKLENELGCELFERSGRSFRLTPEGENLFRYVRRAVEELESGETLVSRRSSLASGELQIGATETSIRYFLGPKLREFHDANPSVSISFRGATTAELCRLLQEGSLEIAFLFTPVPSQFDFHLKKLTEIRDIPVVSSSFPIDRNKVYTPLQLTDYPLISVTQDNSVRSIFDDWFHKDGAMFLPDYTVKSMNLVLSLVENGLGIGMVPEPYALPGIENGSLVRLTTTSLPAKRILYAASLPAVPISVAAKAFLAMFR